MSPSSAAGDSALTITPLRGMPEVQTGDDLAALLLQALQDNGIHLQDDDVLVVSSKVVSKAQGLVASSADRVGVVAGETEWVVAERVSDEVGLTRVVKAVAGPVMAAAGVDASNTGGRDLLLLLPHDPDAACRTLRDDLVRRLGLDRLGVVLSDTAGRAWRVGQVDFALGASGVAVTDDLRGGVDADGRGLVVTTRAVADELAAAADLVKGKASAVPAAHLRGLPHGAVVAVASPGDAGAASLVRTGPADWFGLGRAESVRAALGVPPGSDLALEVGVASSAPEPVATRLARAVSVAIHDQPEVGVDVGPSAERAQQVVVSAPDPVDLGVAVGRLSVALWGEWLQASESARTSHTVTLEITQIDSAATGSRG